MKLLMLSPAQSAHLKNTYGPSALVTGASSGIGRETARLLARAGLDLVVSGRGGASLDALASEARDLGVAVRVIEADLADPDAPRRLATATEDLDLGLLVSAAGHGSAGPFLATDLDTELRMLSVNAGATLALTRLVAPRLAARQGRGGIMMFGSLLGWQGTPWSANYAATKAYVQSLAEALHVELGPHGVDVLSVAPGPVATGFAERAGMTMGPTEDAAAVAVRALQALGRRGTVVPGGRSRTLTWGLAALPRPLRVRAIGRAVRGMATPTSATAAAGPAARTEPTAAG